MLRKLLLAFAFLIPVTLAAAQNEPPPLDGPDHWQIHDENGAMDLEITAFYLGYGDDGDYYSLEITGTVNGQPYTTWALAIDPGDGQKLDVYNGDSKLWTEWHWDGDHYDKVGGTQSQRSYYPVYE